MSKVLTLDEERKILRDVRGDITSLPCSDGFEEAIEGLDKLIQNIDERKKAEAIPPGGGGMKWF